ncbi:MAG: DinB family protein [Anaerolineae bacterium]|nr:DinB family protein [Anaerolineae bacterium]
MPHYAVYLESDPAGTTMAHVLDLPGCTVRANSRAAALEQVPAAIRAYHAWLGRHGETVPEDEAIELAIAGEHTAYGPFTPGDAAALFPPDEAPLTDADLERYARLLTYSRADLLALAGAFPDDLLDWQPAPDAWCLRRILRHIGNAEEWYVSRLVPPETLPPEWEHDEELPLYEFLEMERRTALARLAQLTAEERRAVVYPTHWTTHPDEAWTARKALRRFLEHALEHTGQVRQVLAARRRHLLAHLAPARGELLEPLLNLAAPDLVETLVNEGWTAQDALAHLAAWDRWVPREIGKLVAGEEPDTAAVRDIDAYNARNVAAWKERSLDEVVAELRAARTDWVDWMQALSEEDFFRPRPWGRGDWSVPTWIEIMREHDLEEHARQLATWKRERPSAPAGPKAILAAALESRRQELLAAAELVPPEERASRPVCGTWTLHDVMGHVADWEAWTVAGLRDMAAGRQPDIPMVPSEEAWNQAHASARRGQDWATVWADFTNTRGELLALLDGMDQENLGRAYPGVWDEETTPYAWFLVSYAHDREHARDVRATMVALAGPAEPGPAKSHRSK